MTSFCATFVCAAEEPVFRVHPETVTLLLDRVDFAVKTTPIVTRSFRRLEKNRGLFGPSWCSNVDLVLNGVDVPQPKVIEIYDCMRGQNRTFHKLLDAWIEDSSASRVLRKPDGRWELAEAPYPTFRHDGKLDSFVSEDNVRWFVRRDSNGRPEGIDNLKVKPIKFRRNLAGDLDAITGAGDKPIVAYTFSTVLTGVQVGSKTERYEYDSQGNVLKVLRTEPGAQARLWRFSYTTPEWVSTARSPDGCVSQWLFDRTGINDDGSRASIAKESKTCNKDAGELTAAVTRAVVSPQPTTVVANGGRGLAAKPVQKTVRKPGPYGVGTETAHVTMNKDGHPVLFEVAALGAGKARRIEIDREESTGSALAVRSQGTEIVFRKKPRNFETRQLDLLDEYEAWMAAWSSRQ